jgi:hypothetical protein
MRSSVFEQPPPFLASSQVQCDTSVIVMPRSRRRRSRPESDYSTRAHFAAGAGLQLIVRCCIFLLVHCCIFSGRLSLRLLGGHAIVNPPPAHAIVNHESSSKSYTRRGAHPRLREDVCLWPQDCFGAGGGARGAGGGGVGGPFGMGGICLVTSLLP